MIMILTNSHQYFKETVKKMTFIKVKYLKKSKKHKKNF